MPILYMVATPIGNMDDITMRAVRILSEVDFIFCEDTRVTRKILNHFNIENKVVSYHQHSKDSKIEYIFKLLREEKNIAFVSDAGTPCISDPGGKLVEDVYGEFGDGVKIEPIPGASAVIAALSVSGFVADKFVFLGFPPHKKGRNKFIKQIADLKYTKVLYESKHRILKLLEQIDELGDFEMVVCREITKIHESIYRGSPKDILDLIENDNNAQKGEFVVVIK